MVDTPFVNRARPPARRTRQDHTTAILCIAAAAALGLVAGIAVLRSEAPTKDDGPKRGIEIVRHVPPAPTAVDPHADTAEPDPLAELKRSLKQSEGRVRALRSLAAGSDREQERTSLMAHLGRLRTKLSTWLDEHPADTAGNRLWDRLQRLYVALKKM